MTPHSDLQYPAGLFSCKQRITSAASKELLLHLHSGFACPKLTNGRQREETRCLPKGILLIVRFMSELFSDGAYTRSLAINPHFLCFCPRAESRILSRASPKPWICKTTFFLENSPHVLFSSPFHFTGITLWHKKISGFTDL